MLGHVWYLCVSNYYLQSFVRSGPLKVENMHNLWQLELQLQPKVTIINSVS